MGIMPHAYILRQLHE